MTGLTLLAGHPKTLWYLTRGTGTVALLLLTSSVLLGVASSLRLSGSRVPRFVVSGLHRNLTLLAIAFVVTHVVTTVVDGFAPIGLKDAIVPFVSPYRPVWLGLGAVAFDLLIALVVTSLLRARIGLRLWRALHWLAYAAWPVALVHAFGSGSDVRSSWWLPTLAALCMFAVAAAVLWRAVAARGSTPGLRVGAALAAVGVPIALLGWAWTGPMQTGWAKRSGTPSKLLASSRSVPTQAPVAAKPPAVPAPAPVHQAPNPVATIPSARFRATVDGTIREAPAEGGLVIVRIDASARGDFRGRLHVALRGIPLGGGGVRMLDSSVGLLPDGAAAWYAGRVVALDGQQILADVRGPKGRTVQLLLSLRIDFSGHTVSGSLHGTPANGSPGIAA